MFLIKNNLIRITINQFSVLLLLFSLASLLRLTLSGLILYRLDLSQHLEGRLMMKKHFSLTITVNIAATNSNVLLIPYFDFLYEPTNEFKI